MDNSPSSEQKQPTSEPPAPEVLKPRSSDEGGENQAGEQLKEPAPAKPAQKRRSTYRPSHKATFIGLAVVVLILAANAAIIAVVLKSQSKKSGVNRDQVVISQGVLDKLGVNRSSIGDSGVQLIVGPDAQFNGKVQISGDLSVSGQTKLNNKLSAPSASLANLQAGKTALSELNVNGNSTLSKLSLRNDLSVNGTTRLNGTVTVSSLLAVNNSLSVSGNLGVGGTLSVGRVSTASLTISGHVVTLGSRPGVSRESCIGSNGTVSISGNDESGTVAVNVGAGACAGTLANVSFRSNYGNTPHVVISPIGRGMDGFYANRNAGGFSIGTSNAPSPGGYAFDYIVEQ